MSPDSSPPAYGIERSYTAALDFYLIVTAAVAVGIAIILAYASYRTDRDDTKLKLTDVIGTIVLLAGLSIGYFQWRMARYEASIERLYDRIDIANRRLGDIVKFASENNGNPYLPPNHTGVSVFDMWVFSELDNLEYILEKYQLGWISEHHFKRGLETFKARCRADPEFIRRSIAACQVAGYRDSTCSVAKQITISVHLDNELKPRQPASVAAQ